MTTKKITLNELRSLVKQIIKEEKNKIKVNINEGRIEGAMFSDYDFKYRGDDVNELVLTYGYMPSERDILKDLKTLKQRFKEGSQYNTFQPKLAIRYPYIYGHNTGFNVYLTTDENSRYEETPFFDEPTGKYAKSGRKIFKF